MKEIILFIFVMHFEVCVHIKLFFCPFRARLDIRKEFLKPLFCLTLHPSPPSPSPHLIFKWLHTSDQIFKNGGRGGGANGNLDIFKHHFMQLRIFYSKHHYSTIMHPPSYILDLPSCILHPASFVIYPASCILKTAFCRKKSFSTLNSKVRFANIYGAD